MPFFWHIPHRLIQTHVLDTWKDIFIKSMHKNTWSAFVKHGHQFSRWILCVWPTTQPWPPPIFGLSCFVKYDTCLWLSHYWHRCFCTGGTLKVNTNLDPKVYFVRLDEMDWAKMDIFDDNGKRLGSRLITSLASWPNSYPEAIQSRNQIHSSSNAQHTINLCYSAV